MPTYEIPDTVQVELKALELPTDVPIDLDLNEKPLAACTKQEVEQAVKAFSVLIRHGQEEIERTIKKHIEFRRYVAHLQAYSEHFDAIDWVRDAPQEPSQEEHAAG